MKKVSILIANSFLLVFITLHSAFAQPTQAEIDKMVKDAQALAKKYSNESAVKKAIKNQPDNNGVKNSLYSSDPGSYGNVNNWKFPAKQTALLASLPKKVFTKTELVNFLNDIYSQLSKKIQPGITSSVQSIATNYNNDGSKMGDAAVTGWYTNYREEALLLIIKAASNRPDDGILLNNCAAILNMSGIEQKAIPLLKYVLQSYPTNAMVLNNLGQAYAGLGETDTAMVYLGRCMKIEPEHPEACNTAGQIEATKGHIEKAIEYFEKSIKSAYSKPAQLKLRKIKQGSKIAALVRPRVKIPEYFNLFKYDLPAQCTSTDNAAILDAEHKAFREMATKQAQQYGARYGEMAQREMQKGMQIMNANGAGRVLKKDEFMAHPFFEFCEVMAGELQTEYSNDLTDFTSRITKKYTSDFKTLQDEYLDKLKIINTGFTEREKDCGEGKSNSNCPTTEEKCTAYNNLANQYLPKFAVLTEDWQKKGRQIYQQYFDELVYWHYLTFHPLGDDKFKMRYYEYIMKYMEMMVSICQTKIIKPCEFTATQAIKESNVIDEAECPLEISIPFIVGKFELDCDKIAFSGGEGAVFSYEKNFKTKQSTLSVGIGAGLDIGKISAGPLEAKVSVGVSETLFITFDGDNKVSDFGLKVGAKVSAGSEVKGEKEVASKKSVEVKRELAKKEAGVSATFGINSGCNFNEGPFKGMIGPKPEVQLNKNVNIYKPG
ncbi:MAG: hypothetical protein SGI83_07615 [Bacteroidota bacterium]|nr:hypothetical protein [Bacteroidota bacterium]